MSGSGGNIQCSSPSAGCNNQPPQLKFYQAFTFATPIIFTLVLLLLFCVLYVRRRQTARAVSQLRAQFFARGLFSAWPMDHGLTKSFRDALPIVVFDENLAATREDNQCAVCLSDYQLNEKLQQLPLCDHIFHVECIDEWLASNATCPICRTSLLQPGKLVPLESLAVVASTQDSSSTANCSTPAPAAAAAGGVAPPAAECSTSRTIEQQQQQQREQQPSLKAAAAEGTTSMENAVKDSAAQEHVIHIERS